MSDLLYREQVLELFRSPYNRGTLEGATHSHREHNPLCGDDLTLQVMMKNDGIVDVMFSGDACAICTAAASLVTDEVKGKSLSEVMKMSKNDVLELLGISLSPTRLKCALLPLEGIKRALEGKNNA